MFSLSFFLSLINILLKFKKKQNLVDQPGVWDEEKRELEEAWLAWWLSLTWGPGGGAGSGAWLPAGPSSVSSWKAEPRAVLFSTLPPGSGPSRAH